jgi:hypothetical protein
LAAQLLSKSLLRGAQLYLPLTGVRETVLWAPRRQVTSSAMKGHIIAEAAHVIYYEHEPGLPFVRLLQRGMT